MTEKEAEIPQEDQIQSQQQPQQQAQLSKEDKDRHYYLRKCCKNIFEDLKTLEEYEAKLKKEKIEKKKKEKELAKEKEKGNETSKLVDGETNKLPEKEEINEKKEQESNNNEIPVDKAEVLNNQEKSEVPPNQEEEEEEAPTVDCDLLFIMDCTGSMASYINMCRTQLFLIVEQVKKQFAKSELKIGFVGFRDFGDSKQFEVYNFTTQYDLLKAFINGVQATGGNDTAEDVAGAFQKALEMPWSSEAKYAILITDAYPHGNKYCKSNSGDRYPHGDPEGRIPENQIGQMIKKGIAFYGLDVSATSNQMYQIFNQSVLRQTGKNMDRIQMSNAQNPQNNANGLGGMTELPAFAKAISTSVTNTITQTITTKTMKSQKDVFNSKIMKIINNNRKFGTRFSRTNMSSKTEDDPQMEDYKNFQARYNNNYYSSSDDSYSSDSDDDIRYARRQDSFDDDDYDDDGLFYYQMRSDFQMERKPFEQNSSIPQPVRGNISGPIKQKSTYQDNDEVAGLQIHQITKMQQQKRDDCIEMMTDIIREDEDEEKEEEDDKIYVEKRRERKVEKYVSKQAISEIENPQPAEKVSKHQGRNQIIQEDISGEADADIRQPPQKEKRKGVDEDPKDRKIDPYIKLISEEAKKKTFQTICYSFHIDDSKAINWEEPQLVQNQIKTVLTVEKEKFSEGAMREAFLATDRDFNIELVAKLHKETELNLKYNFLKKELTGLILAQFFLTEFNQRILFTMDVDQLPPQILRFVDCYIYEVREDDLTKPSYFYSVENLMKGDFQKYNNNAGYVIDGDLRKESQLSQAFSHFTWQYSQGHCMVVDLQGTEDGQLTDPQIHTLQKTKKFGQGDLGYEGILRFFRTHSCTSFCKGLSLIHPKHHREIKENYQFEDFHALQKLQIEKQKQLKNQFNYEQKSEIDSEDEADSKEEEDKEIKEEEKLVLKEEEKIEVKEEEETIPETKPEVIAKAEEKPIEEVIPEKTDPIIEPIIEKAPIEVIKPPAIDDEETKFGIDEFFGLEIDVKLMESFVPLSAYVAKPKKRTAPSTTHTAARPPQADYLEQQKDCTRLICSLCKKVNEYNTKELLASNKKLNKIICKTCQGLSDLSDKMRFDCTVCNTEFEVSSYILKMKRIDKAARCEKCSLF